ncbi:MAG: urease accessory protein UreD [Myxococcota bacterium]
MGELSLGYGRRGERTIPTERRHVGPLRVLRHFYPEGDGLLQHVVVHPPGGVATGDQLQVRLDLAEGAQVQLTTPGATSWYRARSAIADPPTAADALQEIRATLAPDATLEWLPQPTILFDGARARLKARFDLADGARLLAWDLVALGRRAGDLPFRLGSLRYDTQVRRAGRLLHAERLVLDAVDRWRDSALGLGGADVFGTFIVAAPDLQEHTLTACRVEPAPPGDRAALTLLPGLLVARYVGTSTERAQAWLRRLWHITRPAVLGRPAVPPRIWST